LECGFSDEETGADIATAYTENLDLTPPFVPTILHNCETTWVGGIYNATQAVSTDKQEGTYSLKITAGSGTPGYVYHSFPSPYKNISGTNYIHLWIKGDSNFNALFWIWSDFSWGNGYYWNVPVTTNWHRVSLDLSNPDVTYGSGADLSNIRRIRVDIPPNLIGYVDYIIATSADINEQTIDSDAYIWPSTGQHINSEAFIKHTNVDQVNADAYIIDKVYEDFTTYTEADPNNKLTQTTVTCKWDSLICGDSAWVYKDYGVNHFNRNFEHWLDIKYSSPNYPTYMHWSLANNVDSFENCNYALGLGCGSNQLYLNENYNGTRYKSNLYAWSQNVPYYVKIIRDEGASEFGTLYCYIYSDSARTNLIHILQLNLHGKQDFRYLYSYQAWKVNTGHQSSGSTRLLYLADVPLRDHVSANADILDPASEDLTTFVEVDPNNYWSVHRDKCIGTNVPQNDNSYIYKDYGVDYFDSYMFEFSTHVGDAPNLNTRVANGIWAVTNSPGAYNDMGSGQMLYYQHRNIDNMARLVFEDKGTATQVALDIPDDSTYYIKIERIGSRAICRVYPTWQDRIDDTNIISLMDLPCQVTKWRYLLVGYSYNFAGYTDTMNSYIQSVKIFDTDLGARVFGTLYQYNTGNSLFVDSHGYVHVTYYDIQSSTAKLLYAISIDGGSTFTDGEGGGSGTYKQLVTGINTPSASPAILVDSSDNIFVFYDNSSNQLNMIRKVSGVWQATTVIGNNASSQIRAEVDNSDNLIVACTMGSALSVYTSINQGASWDTEVSGGYASGYLDLCVGYDQDLWAIVSSNSHTQIHKLDKETTSNVVSHFVMNDDAADTIVDDSEGVNDGTLMGGNNTQDISVTGKINKALQLDGTLDYVNCGNDTSLQISKGTMSAWIKTADAGSGYKGIVVKQYAWGMFLNSNVFGFYNWSAASFTSTGVNLADNNWHLVTVTFDHGVFNGTKAYIDGVYQTQGQISVVNQTKDLVIGAGEPGGGSGQNFAGAIDDVRIYDKIIDGTELAFIHNSGNGTENPLPPSPIDEWTWEAAEVTEDYSTITGVAITCDQAAETVWAFRALEEIGGTGVSKIQYKRRVASVWDTEWTDVVVDTNFKYYEHLSVVRTQDERLYLMYYLHEDNNLYYKLYDNGQWSAQRQLNTIYARYNFLQQPILASNASKVFYGYISTLDDAMYIKSFSALMHLDGIDSDAVIQRHRC
jgi:hypothetical protein